jgi:hypothetical protein
MIEEEGEAQELEEGEVGEELEEREFVEAPVVAIPPWRMHGKTLPSAPRVRVWPRADPCGLIPPADPVADPASC